MRIEIIGGMGVGKTTLCNSLESLGYSCVYESLEKNPYLELSYQDPEAFGFYSQLSFVLGNFFTAVQNSNSEDATFFDYSTITDKAYATLFLKGKARDIALQTVDYLEEKEGRADLFLYLTCSPAVQLERISARNREHESSVGYEFISMLDSYVDHYVRQADLDGANIMTIDTEQIDLRNDKEFVFSMCEEIKHMMDTPLKNYRTSDEVRYSRPIPDRNHDDVVLACAE